MLQRVFLLAAGLFAFSTWSAIAAGLPRLQNNVVPLSYDLSVILNVQAMQTNGEETLAILVRKPTDAIIVNWLGLDVSDPSLDGQPVTIELHKALQQLWLRSAVPISPGKHTLHLTFRSEILDFFTSKGFWNDGSFIHGKPSLFLVTMFEPSTARLMFPSFDEPGFRASFTVHVTAPSEWTVVSNMPAAKRTPIDAATTRTDFAQSPPMPTYLLTIDAGVMTSIAGESDDIPIHVYDAPETANLDLILPRAQRLLHFYNDYLGVRYPLPKLDIIAAPGRYQTALEQWGAMTFYQASDITTGSLSDPAASERRAFEELAHEMGHQWFGDLVGMQWWRDAFVAEGLTQWLTAKADFALEPGWPWYRDEDANVDFVMEAGITKKSLPVITTLATDYEKDDWIAFSPAAYFKSAALLNLWETYIGEQRFRQALRGYLRRYAGTAVTFEQFWGSFNDPLARRYGDAWLKRPGFPVVTVALRCANGRQTARFSQTPFINGRGAPPGYTKQIWPVPILIAIGDGVAHPYLMQGRSQVVAAGRCGQAVSIDPGLRPYYRIRYMDDRLTVARLASASERDRTNAAIDAAALNDVGIAPAGYFLRFASLIRATDSPAVIRPVINGYTVLLAALAPGPERNAVAAAARAFLGPVIQQMPKSTGNAQPQPYTNALYALAQIGYPAFAAQAQAQLDASRQGSLAWFLGPPLSSLAAGSADEQHLRMMESLPEKDPMQFSYLTNVGSPALAQQVFAKYASNPAIVFGLANLHPVLGWKFLQMHTRELLSRVPPSQQATTLSSDVANTFWFLPSSQVRGYLKRQLGRYNVYAIRVAMEQIATRRAASATAAQQVRRWLRP